MVRCKNAAGSSQPPPPEPAEIPIFENDAAEHPNEKDFKKKSINVTLVKEFYAHFTDPNQGTVYVRAERVEFTAKAINKFFVIKKKADLHTPFVNGMKDKTIDFLLENLCFLGAEWDETNTTVERDRLKPAAKLWTHFLKQNLMPTTQTATVNLPSLQLLHSILNFCSINLGQLIVDEAFAGITCKESPLLFPRLIIVLYRQKGVMEDETYFYIRARQGIKPTQIPSLMGFDEDATARAPPGGARTIAAARLAELMAITEKSKKQLQDIHNKLTSLFHYMRERDETIQSYFLELLPDEVPLFPIFHNDIFHPAQSTRQRASQEHATLNPPPPMKNAASTSTATPQTHPPSQEEHEAIAMPQATTQGAHATTSAPKPPAKSPTSARQTVELDSEEDEDMPDAPSQQAPTFDRSVLRRRFKRTTNRNINMADLAAAVEAGPDNTGDNGPSTTPNETPMTSPPQSKARYKRVATRPTPPK
ncbi:hypothetical protein V6N13_048610 [Hibiscus sabdariffa]